MLSPPSCLFKFKNRKVKTLSNIIDSRDFHLLKWLWSTCVWSFVTLLVYCFSEDRTEFSLVPCVCFRKSRNTIDSRKSRFPKNGDFVISSPRIYGKCFSLVAMFWRAHSHIRNTNFCLLYLKSNLSKGETWKASFFCTVSFISTIFALLPVITLVYEFKKLFLNLLNLLNLLIQVGNLEMDVCMYLLCIYCAASITFAKNIEPAACAIDLKHGD